MSATTRPPSGYLGRSRRREKRMEFLRQHRNARNQFTPLGVVETGPFVPRSRK